MITTTTNRKFECCIFRPDAKLFKKADGSVDVALLREFSRHLDLVPGFDASDIGHASGSGWTPGHYYFKVKADVTGHPGAEYMNSGISDNPVGAGYAVAKRAVHAELVAWWRARKAALAVAA